jgi:hypothetical protein
MAERFFLSQEAAEVAGTAEITARKWAAQHGVAFVSTGRRKTFIWRSDDVSRFKQRNTARGRPRHAPLGEE